MCWKPGGEPHLEVSEVGVRVCVCLRVSVSRYVLPSAAIGLHEARVQQPSPPWPGASLATIPRGRSHPFHTTVFKRLRTEMFGIVWTRL